MLSHREPNTPRATLNTPRVGRCVLTVSANGRSPAIPEYRISDPLFPKVRGTFLNREGCHDGVPSAPRHGIKHTDSSDLNNRVAILFFILHLTLVSILSDNKRAQVLSEMHLHSYLRTNASTILSELQLQNRPSASAKIPQVAGL